MAKIQESILEFAVTAAEAANTVLVTAITFYEHRGQLDDATGFTVSFVADAAAGTHEVTMGEVVPIPTHFRFTSTFVA